MSHRATDAAAVLFDLDGTLVDSAPDIVAAANHALASVGAGPVQLEAVRGWVGRGGRVLLADALAALGVQADPDALVDAFVDYYQEHPADHCQLYPGARTLLAQLHARGVPMAVVTNKFESVTRRLLRALDIDRFFAAVVGGDTAAHAKPHPAPVLLACQLLGVEPASALMVGDSVNDVRAARAAGVPVVCVSYGYNHGEPITAAAPDAVIDTLTELLPRDAAIAPTAGVD